MATTKDSKAGKTARKSATRKQSPASASTQMPQGETYNPIHVVESREEFEKQAQALRSAGMVEVPGFLGGGRNSGGLNADFSDFIESRLACSVEGHKGSLPLLHVSSGYAQSVVASNGHKGKYITWGDGNRIPNVISLLCSLLPYTAAALKFNIDLCTGMGPKPMYAYTQYVGGNITHKQIPYETADKLILGLIRDLQLQLVKLENDYPELMEEEDDGPDFGVVNGTITEVPPRKSAAAQMRDDIKEQIEQLRKDLAVWQTTNAEVKLFLKNNNLLDTFHHLYSDMLQYNICFPEFELQKTYLVDSGRKTRGGDPEMVDVPTKAWEPKIVGLKWRNAKTMRLEQMDEENRINYNYVSNKWLTSPEMTAINEKNDLKIDAMPALTYQSPSKDLEKIVMDTRKANGRKDSRPTHISMPVVYNEYGHPYYPVPAWYSCFSGDVYTYASLLVSDRKKRRDNANVIGRILYVSDEYVQRMYIQRHLDTPEARRKFFNEEIVKPINDFLKNRDNMGEPMLAYTFKDADGKVYKSWEIIEVQENSKEAAEANKEELAEISSIILFTWGVDSTLIGNTPGTTVRSGGTDLRERYLLKQVNMSLMQRLVLNSLDVVKYRNRWDDHLVFAIQREVLTTLDNSKTGVTTAETDN